MFSLLSEEFSLNNLEFKHSDASDFVKSQWQKESTCFMYAVYRWFVALVFITNFALSLKENTNVREWKIWAIYLTNWGVLLNVFTSILATILVTLQNCSQQFREKLNGANDLPTCIKMYWALQSITVTLAGLITIVYWSVIHKYGTPNTLTNILDHATNSVLLIIDLMVVGHPHRILHMIYTHLVVVTFLIFSVIYYKAGGLNLKYERAIYPLLDWTNFTLALRFCVMLLITVIIVHIFLHGIYRLRIWVHNKFKKKTNSSTIL